MSHSTGAVSGEVTWVFVRIVISVSLAKYL